MNFFGASAGCVSRYDIVLVDISTSSISGEFQEVDVHAVDLLVVVVHIPRYGTRLYCYYWPLCMR